MPQGFSAYPAGGAQPAADYIEPRFGTEQQQQQQQRQQQQQQQASWPARGAAAAQPPPSQSAPLQKASGGWNPVASLTNRLYNSLTSGGPPGARYAKGITRRLQETIKANDLTAFYPKPSQVKAVAEICQGVDFDALTKRWRLPSVELALDLASLALYDVILFCDDSGSMLFYEDGSRIDDLKAVVEKVSEVATLFDADGISVRFFNSKLCGDAISSTPAVASLLAQVKYTGSTPMGEKLYSSVLQPLVYNKRELKKPLLIITVTDGVPDNQRAVFQAIQACREQMKKQQYGPHAVAFQFAQVGNDAAAMRWLGTLDNHPEVGDVVDATSHFEAEAEEWARKNPQAELTPGMWLLKMMLGAIDPQYDEKD